MFAVVITEKGGQQRRLDFDKNEVTIGRVQGNDIILPKGNVSKRHSRIVLKDNRFIVVDLKSTNGTYVNGRKITSPLVVKAGDKIYIGDFILTLEENAAMGASAGGFEPAQPSPAPMPGPPPGPPPMTSPPPMGPPTMGPPPPAPAPQPQRLSAAPPPMPRPAPPPMPGPAPAPYLPPQVAAAPPMPPPAPPMPAPAPPMPKPAPAPAPMPAPAAPAPMPAPSPAPMPAPSPAPMPAAPAPMPAPMPAPSPAPMPAPMLAAPAPVPAPPMPSPAPAPMPSPASQAAPPMPAPPAPTPMAGGAAERFPLDEEPAGMDDRGPSPRVVASSHGMSPAPMPAAPVLPAPMPVSPAPIAPAPVASSAPHPGPPQPPTPAATPRAMAPKGAQGALSAVVDRATRSFDPHGLTAPLASDDPRWEAARRAVDAALESVAQSGGPNFDRDRVGNAALDELVGLGALGALMAGSAREIVVHGPAAVLVDEGQGLSASDAYFSSSEALSLIVGRLVAVSGGTLDASRAQHSGLLPSGFHFSAVMPPVAVGGPFVELRRVTGRGSTAEQLVGRGVLSNDMLELLRRAVRARKALVVIGAADAGVTACVSALTNLIGEDERVVVVESAPALELASSNVVRLTAAAGLTMDELVAQGGRMRGDRIVIDGVHGPETLGALLTVASRSGSILGVHSAPGGDTLGYLGALARLGGSNPEALGRILPSAASVLVRLTRGGDGRGRVESIAEVRSGGGGAQVVELCGVNFAPTGQSPSF